MPEVVDLESKHIEHGRIKCVCIGEEVKNEIHYALIDRAKDAERLLKEHYVYLTQASRDALKNRIDIYKELADLIMKIPPCE